jgi:hypothetical protein
MTLGKPYDTAQQLRVIKATLKLLELPATGKPENLEEYE